jgi:hypothetical protein
MFPIESGGELPGMFLIEVIAHDNFSGSIGSALLEVVTVGDSIVIVANATSLLRTVRCFTVRSERTSVEPFQDNLFVGGRLREDPGWVHQAKNKGNETHKKDRYNSAQRCSPFIHIYHRQEELSIHPGPNEYDDSILRKSIPHSKTNLGCDVFPEKV